MFNSTFCLSLVVRWFGCGHSQDPSGVLPRASGDGANTSSAGYVRLEAEFQGGEDDFNAATPDAIAYFAASVGWLSFFVVDSPATATPVSMVLGGVDDLFDATPDAIAHVAAIVGCFRFSLWTALLPPCR